MTWSRTEYFEATLEVEDHQAGDPSAAFDGDSQELVDLEEPNAVDLVQEMTYQSTEREVESVELVDESAPTPSYGVGR